MPFRRLDKRLMPLLRGGLVTASAMAFFAVAVGVPVPSVTLKDRSVAFPCMDRSCGCHDAAGCKEHCCCFSSEEKLVWAAEHGVDPALFVDDQALVAVVMDGCDEHHAEENHNRLSASCCATKNTADAELNRRARLPDIGRLSPFAPRKDVLSRSERRLTRRTVIAHGYSQRATDQRHSHDVLSISAYRQCHGLAPLWTLLGAALPPPERVSSDFQWMVRGQVAQQDCTFATISFSPPTPPPRV
jgi:hypothetical protein